MKHYNEKPSSIGNLGQDIPYASRHRFDTYEQDPTVRAAKEFKKTSTVGLKDLKTKFAELFKAALSQSTEAGIEVLKQYELEKCILSNAPMAPMIGKSFDELRAFVVAMTNGPDRKSMVSKFNRLANTRQRIRYIRPINLASYFDTKSVDQFTELNGRKSPWQLETKVEGMGPIREQLGYMVKAVQFGNSVPDAEREYCVIHLGDAIYTLNQYLDFDFRSLGFSFGARGKRGSIAHYQDSLKVLAFNRHWDGALIHELGHAIDYALGLVSSEMPYSLKSKYNTKLDYHKIKNQEYYRDTKEIFARAFEVWCSANIPELKPFALSVFDARVLPYLDAEFMAWMDQVLKPILRRV